MLHQSGGDIQPNERKQSHDVRPDGCMKRKSSNGALPEAVGKESLVLGDGQVLHVAAVMQRMEEYHDPVITNIANKWVDSSSAVVFQCTVPSSSHMKRGVEEVAGGCAGR